MKDHDQLVKMFLDGIDFKVVDQESHDVDKFFPETKQETKERARQIVNRKVTKYGEHDKKILHLIVSHGYIVECFSTLNGGERTFPDYCAISAL